jgi:hypothetical protein
VHEASPFYTKQAVNSQTRLTNYFVVTKPSLKRKRSEQMEINASSFFITESLFRQSRSMTLYTRDFYRYVERVMQVVFLFKPLCTDWTETTTTKLVVSKTLEKDLETQNWSLFSSNENVEMSENWGMQIVIGHLRGERLELVGTCMLVVASLYHSRKLVESIRKFMICYQKKQFCKCFDPSLFSGSRIDAFRYESDALRDLTQGGEQKNYLVLITNFTCIQKKTPCTEKNATLDGSNSDNRRTNVCDSVLRSRKSA